MPHEKVHANTQTKIIIILKVKHMLLTCKEKLS